MSVMQTFAPFFALIRRQFFIAERKKAVILWQTKNAKKMKILFNLEYYTTFGEQLLLNIPDGKGTVTSYGMTTLDGHNWVCELPWAAKAGTYFDYYYSVCRGEEVVRQILSRLTALKEKHFDWNVLHTLAVYLLDTECSMTASAELLHLHQNTIKYRINVIANTLGFRPGKIPDSMQLYRALAIDRLLQT